MPPPLPIAQFYDFLAASYDWLASWEVRARRLAWEQLQPVPGQRILNVGCGPGRELALLQEAVQPGGLAVGIDLSWRMALSAGKRPGAAVCQADGRDLPFPAGIFDGIYCAYVLDLVERAALPDWLVGFRRVLRPGGRLVTLSLTEGVDTVSRAVVRLWKALYRLSPLVCGGCYPLTLAEWVTGAGFVQVTRLTQSEWGVPSEIISAQAPAVA